MKSFSRLFLTVVTAVALLHQKQPLPFRVYDWFIGRDNVPDIETTSTCLSIGIFLDILR